MMGVMSGSRRGVDDGMVMDFTVLVGIEVEGGGVPVDEEGDRVRTLFLKRVRASLAGSYFG